MKVVQVIPDLGVGGAERMLVNLVGATHRSVDVTVVSLWPRMSPPIIARQLEDLDVNVIHLDKAPGVDLAIFRKLARQLDSLDPDVVHTHRMAVRYTLPWTWKRRDVSHVHTVHTLADREATALDQRLIRVAARHRRLSMVACGPEVTRSVRSVYGLEPFQIENGIHLAAAALTPNDGLFNGDAPLRLVAVARLVEVKNHALLLRALASVRADGRDVVLRVVGDGPLRASLEAQCRSLKLDDAVTFIGQVADVGPELLAADVSILSSRYEGSPLSVMESMAVGTPVLGPDLGGIRYLLRDGGGWMFDGGHEDLTRKMASLHDDRKVIYKAALEARRIAIQRFSAERMGRLYIDRYRRCRVESESMDRVRE